MQDWPERERYTAEDLLQIIRILRDRENGCPWDKVQTHASIRKNFLEETCEASVIRPVKDLKHFEKVALQPGETKQLTYTLSDDDLKYFDEAKHEWVAERGTFTIHVGSSSADIRGKVKYNY